MTRTHTHTKTYTYVYLIWEDQSEHGDNPLLVEVFDSEHKANLHINQKLPTDDPDHYTIERRRVN